MSWNDPGRRRKVVTYGKSSRNTLLPSRQSLSFSATDDVRANAFNAPSQSELQARPQPPQKTYMHRPKPTLRTSAEESPGERVASLEDSHRSLRSPKRRKVSDDRDESPSDSEPSPKPTTDNTDGVSTRQPRRLNSQSTNGFTSSGKPAIKSPERARRLPNRDTKSTDLDRSVSVVMPSRTEDPDNYYSPTVPAKSRRLVNRERVRDRSVSSPEPDTTENTEEPRTRKRLIDSLDAQSNHEDESSTEPDSIGCPSSPEISTPIPKTPTAAGSQGSYGRGENIARTLANDTAETATPQSISPRITYARQRSFLSNLDLQHGLNPSGGLRTEGDLHGLAMQATSTVNVDSEQTEEARTVRSIHELRRAGINARFQGMVDSILEDIEHTSNSVSVQRNGLIQLCEKLLEDSFAQRFIESGSFVRLANSLSGKLDVVLSLLSTEAYALMLRVKHLPQSMHVAFWPKLVAMAPTLLPLQEGIPKLLLQRRFGLSRINQSTIKDVSNQSRGVMGLDDDTVFSPRRLILHCMQHCIRKVRESEVPEILPTEVVSELVNISLKLSSEHATNENAILNSYTILDSIISILETYTTSSTSIGDSQQDALTLLAGSSPFLLSLNNKNDAQSLQLLTLYLKLILNITNANSRICEGFATPGLIHSLVTIVVSGYPSATGESTNEKKDSLDIVILALGALINLTEENEAARERILSQSEDESENSETLLDRLLELFMEGLDTVSEADSVGQTHYNVAFGYLSILLCTLCLNSQVRSVLKALANGTGLNKLLATVEEFLHYHRQVDEELSHSQSLGEFTLRLQRILDEIKGSSIMSSL